MRSRFRFTRALRAHVSRLSILVLLLASTAMGNIDGNIAPSIIVNDSVNSSIVGGGGGAVSYWLLAFLLAVNIAGVIHMRWRAATIKSREDKE
jgi:hypothetical protein